jgi:hypothetical protein
MIVPQLFVGCWFFIFHIQMYTHLYFTARVPATYEHTEWGVLPVQFGCTVIFTPYLQVFLA